MSIDETELTPVNIDSLINSINKEFDGSAIMCRASDIGNPFRVRIPTGSIGLDCAIGGGSVYFI